MKKIALCMMALVMTFSVMAQRSDNAGERQHRSKPEKFSRIDDNFESLNLTADQQAQMKSINESFRQQMQDLRKNGSITVNEQKAKRQALVQEHRAKVMSILTPEQRQQAKELKGSMKSDRKGGRRGGRIEQLTKDLNLSPEQTTKVATLNATLKNNISSLHTNTSLTEEQKKQQMKELIKKHKSDIESLLTSEQKDQLKSHRKNHPSRAVK